MLNLDRIMKEAKSIFITPVSPITLSILPTPTPSSHNAFLLSFSPDSIPVF